MTPSPDFQSLFRALDLERPLNPDDPTDAALYVPDMHKADGINPVDRLQAAIEMSDRPGTWLFTGHRGVGKSTELRRMAAQLRRQGHLVVVADMGEYLNLAEPLHTETLLLTLTAALADGSDQFLGGERLVAGYAQRAWDFLCRTEVQLAEISPSLGEGDAKLSLKFQLKENPAFRDQVLKAVSGAVGVLAKQVRAFAQQVLKDLQAKRGEQAQVVLILDSLERLRVTGDDAKVCYDAITRTFDVYAEHLKLEHIHVVYSVPPYLPFLCPRIGAYFGVEICTLPHVKVFETPRAAEKDVPAPDNDNAGSQNDGPGTAAPCAQGLELMVSSVRKRYPAVEQLISLPQLQRLAWSSSGAVRDYFRLVKSVCVSARVAQAATPLHDDRWIDHAEQVLRNEMPLADDDKTWLRKVRKTHGNGLASMSQLHELARLFDSGVILNYRNGHDWCEVHALLQAELRE